MTYMEYRTDEEVKAIKRMTADEMLDTMKLFTKDEAINVLPCDDLTKGTVGYSIWKVQDGVETKSYPSIKVFKEASIVDITEKEKFNDLFEDAFEKDYPITICENPAARLLGFIVEKRSARILYRIPLFFYKDVAETKADAKI